ncbi:MAG: class I SAM-dependent methyltransferase [Thermostichus sp. DG_1_6_bins_120]
MELPQTRERWDPYLSSVASRFNRELERQLGQPGWQLPPDLEQLTFWQACRRDHLQERLGIPFAQLRAPRKRENCLDLGCGVGFLTYPWNDWQANFYGHELSGEIVRFVRSRAPQLNSKLFKSIQQGSAHRLENYVPEQFDLAIATGFLYYYPLEYFAEVWRELLRVLRPAAPILIEVVNPESVWAEQWGLIELFKGAEPIFTPLAEWEQCIRDLGGKIQKQASGELFTTYLIQHKR